MIAAMRTMLRSRSDRSPHAQRLHDPAFACIYSRSASGASSGKVRSNFPERSRSN